MAETIDDRPYTLRTVVIDDGLERPIAAYSNHDQEVGEWPVFTRDQVAGLLESTDRSHFQTFWIEEIGTFATVTGYGNSLPEDFDVAPYMEAILNMEEVDEYQDGNGFNIAYAVKRVIEVDGEQLVTFSFDHVGWDFCRALHPAPTAGA